MPAPVSRPQTGGIQNLLDYLCRRPLLWLAVCFCMGVFCAARLWLEPCLLAGALGAGLLILAFLRRSAPQTPGHFQQAGLARRMGLGWVMCGLGLLLFALGGVRYQWQESALDAAWTRLSPHRFCEADIILTEPPEAALASDEPGFWSGTALLTKIDGGDTGGGIPVLVYGQGSRALARGDVLRARIMLYPRRAAAFAGAFSYDDYLRTQRLCGRVKIVAPRRATSNDRTVAPVQQSAPEDYRLIGNAGGGIRGGLDRVRAYAVRNTLALVPGQAGAFLAAAMFGYRGDLERGTRDLFREVGIGHILAISGLHVGMVCGLGWLAAGAFTHDRRKTALVCIGVCLLYLALSGGRTAALRAGVIALVYLCGICMGRRGDFLNSLGTAALLIVGFNPYELFSLGFQLSFGAVLFISCCDREFARLWVKWTDYRARDANADATPPGEVSASLPLRLLQKIGMLAVMSLSAWLGVWPLTAQAFNEVSFSGLAINIVAVPLMSLALGGGILLQGAGLLPQALAESCAWLLTLPAEGMLLVAQWGSRLPGGGVSVFAPPPWLMGLYYLVFAAYFCRGCVRSFPGYRIWRILPTLLVPAVCLLLAIFSFHSAAPNRERLYALPGQYGFTLIHTAANGTVTVCGSLQRGGEDVRRFLYSLRINRVDTLYSISPRADSAPTDIQPLRKHVNISRVIDAATGYRPQTDTDRDGGLQLAATLYERGGDLAAYRAHLEGHTVICGNWLWPSQLRALLRNANKPGERSMAFAFLRGNEDISADVRLLPPRDPAAPPAKDEDLALSRALRVDLQTGLVERWHDTGWQRIRDEGGGMRDESHPALR